MNDEATDRRPPSRRASARVRAQARAWAVAASALALGLAGPARLAIAASHAGSLGTAPSAAALFAVDCTDSGSGPPASLTLQISNVSPISGLFLSAQIRKGNLATNTTDPVDADALPSPVVFVNGGAGRYDVFVDKTGGGAESFVLMAQCWTGAGGGGLAAGTVIVPAQGGSVPAGSLGGVIALLGLAIVCARTSISRRPRGAH